MPHAPAVAVRAAKLAAARRVCGRLHASTLGRVQIHMSVRMRAALVGAALTLVPGARRHEANGASSVASSSKAAVKKTATKRKHGQAAHNARYARTPGRQPLHGQAAGRGITARRACSSTCRRSRRSPTTTAATAPPASRATAPRSSTSSTQLRAAGYNPTTQVFDFVTFEEPTDAGLRAQVRRPRKTYTRTPSSTTMSYSACG